jgi:hypothetical protein
MSSTWKSPRKNQGMRPERYGNEPREKPPSKSKVRPIGKKRKASIRGRPPVRNHSSDSSSESTGYQDSSDGDISDDGPTVIDVSKKKQKMPSRIHRGRSKERRSKDDETSDRRRIEDEIHENDDSDDEYAENNRQGVQITANMRSGKDVRKRMFVDEGSTKRITTYDYENEEEQEDEDSDDGKTLLGEENRRKDRLIATLTKKVQDLERTVNEMSNATRTDSRDKTEWTGEEMNFVKAINDFCKEKLYPKEKFLKKNWQLYLPNDRTSLCWVVMKNLSIPERSDPMDIWSRVIVPSIREKYQSMRCNMTTKIKGIYMSMKNLYSDVPTLQLSAAKY